LSRGREASIIHWNTVPGGKKRTTAKGDSIFIDALVKSGKRGKGARAAGEDSRMCSKGEDRNWKSHR